MKFNKEILLDFIFPRHCPICEEVMSSGMLICESCNAKTSRIREPVCKKCGKPIENERGEYCNDCMRKKHYFTQGKAVFVYAKGMRESLYRFKYSNKREYADFYAKEAADSYAKWIVDKEIEAIVPVPMFFWKRQLRGYNQAEVFAKALGKKVQIPVDNRLIKRNRNTIPQKMLNDIERKRNLKNAFQLVPNIVKYKQVVLVDDIYTTGSTMDEIAEILLAADVKKIYYICISIGKGC